MTKRQRIWLMATGWPDACAQQKWDVRDRDRRLEVCSQALGRNIASTNEIDDDNDFTLVKNRLLFLAGNLKGAAEDGSTRENKRRQKLEIIRKHSEVITALRGQRYLWAILRNRFKTTYPETLSGHELHQCLYTLARTAARLNKETSVSSEAEPVVFAGPPPVDDNEPF